MTDRTSLVHVNLSDPQDAKDVFQRILRGKEGSHEALALVRENPQAALMALQKGDQALGLSLKGSADILDEVVGAVGDPAEARALMNSHLTAERQAELLQGRGDLPAVASEIVDLDVVLRAVHDDVRAAGGVSRGYADDDEDLDGEGYGIVNPRYGMMLVLRSWALKLKDRPDYPQYLSEELGSASIRDWLLIAIWHEAACPDDSEEIPFGYFDELGLDPLEAAQDLAAMLTAGRVPRIDASDIAEARLAFTRRRREIEEAATVTDAVREAREEAEEAAENIDL